MAEPETPENQENQQEQPTKAKEKKSSGSMLYWIILALVVIISAGGGLGVGYLFAGSKGKSIPADETTPLQEKQEQEIDKILIEGSDNGSKSWFYPLGPVVANLNEPGVNRYVRMSLTLEVSSAVNQTKGTLFLDEKTPLLINCLTVYLSSLSIEDVRGDKNLKRIQLQIKDLLNQKLFPDTKPQITSILFKEFSIV
jgi:flagellar basal body-associated protein FliL